MARFILHHVSGNNSNFTTCGRDYKYMNLLNTTTKIFLVSCKECLARIP